MSRQGVEGTITGLRTYQRGLCAKATAFGGENGLLKQLNTQFWTAFQQLAGHPAIRLGEYALSYLRYGNGNNDVKGGFFQILSIEISAVDNLIQVWLDSNYNYDFALTNGILSIVPHENELTVTGPKDPGEFRTALSQTLPATFQTTTLLKQAQNIPLISLLACDKADPTVNACGGAAEDLANTFTPPPGAFLPDEIKQLKCSLGAATACTAVGRDAPTALAAAWACVDRPNSPEDYSHCEYVLRAQRLNVFEDGVELVFYDAAPDLTNPVFAFQQLLFGQGGSDQAAGNSICDPRPADIAYQQPPVYTPAIYSRSFVRDIQSDYPSVITDDKIKSGVLIKSRRKATRPTRMSAH